LSSVSSIMIVSQRPAKLAQRSRRRLRARVVHMTADPPQHRSVDAADFAPCRSAFGAQPQQQRTGIVRIGRAFDPGRIRQAIQRLAAMRDGLRHAAACSAASHMECPRFRRIVRLASTGRLGPPDPRLPPQRRLR